MQPRRNQSSLDPACNRCAGVGFAPSGSAAIPASEEDPACGGTWQSPTAPVGKVCIYVADAVGFTADSVSAPPLLPFNNDGFVLRGNSDRAGIIEFGITWAYSAPDAGITAVAGRAEAGTN
jgi:hypothetical protein